MSYYDQTVKLLKLFDQQNINVLRHFGNVAEVTLKSIIFCREFHRRLAELRENPEICRRSVNVHEFSKGFQKTF